MAARRLHEQGVERASAVLHRNVGRLQQRVDEMEYRLRDHMHAAASARRKRFDHLATRLRALDLRLRFAAVRRRLEAAQTAIARLVHLRVTRARGRLDPLAAQLIQLSPLKILERGYAIVTNADGVIVKQPGDAPPGSNIDVRLAKDRLAARVIPPE